MITSQSNGHPIYFDTTIQDWRYIDNNKIISERACLKCGKNPTKEGYDACIGFLPNVIHACCGHGIEKPYVVFEDNKRKLIEFENIEEMKIYFDLIEERK